jgi:hypothetical protein
MNTKIKVATLVAVLGAAACWALWSRGGEGTPTSALSESRAASQPAAQAYPPSTRALRISPASLDFGGVALGQTRVLEIRVENTSAAPVSVFRVGGSCECISGEMKEGVIQPGRSVTGQIRFTGIAGRGDYSGSANFITDETGPSRYELPVRGLVLEELSLDPALLHFGKMTRNATVFREAKLWNRQGQTFTVTGVQGATEPFEVKVVPHSSAQGSAYTITASMKGLRPGPQSQTVTIQTDCGKMPELRLTLVGEVDSDFKCVPDVAVARVKLGEISPLEVVVENGQDNTPFKIRSVREGNNVPLQFFVDELDARRRKVIVQFSEFPRDGAPVGELLISVDRQDAPLRVSYRLEGLLPKQEGKP